LSIALNLLLANRLSADASSLLANRAAAVASTTDVENGKVRLNETPDDAALDEQAWVFDARGRAVEHPPAGPRVAAPVAGLSHVRRTTETNPTDHIRLRAQPVEHAGAVVVGVSMDAYRHTERLAVTGTFVLGVFVLLAGALVARRAVGLALRPVADMTATAA